MKDVISTVRVLTSNGEIREIPGGQMGFGYRTSIVEKEDLLVVGDMFYYTIKTSTGKGERFWALRSSDFSLADTLSREYPRERSFPGLRFTSSNDGWVKPRL